MENSLGKWHRLIVGLAFTLLYTMEGYGQVCGLVVGDKFSLPKSAKEVRAVGSSSLEKEIQVVSLLNPSSPSFDRELEVWEHFVSMVDTGHVGFVFLIAPGEDPDALADKWRNGTDMNLPFYYAHQLNCIPENGPKGNTETTLLVENGKIVLIGKCPVTNEPYNQYRSKLDHMLRSRGIVGGVKGAITEEVDGVVRTRFSSTPVYVDQNGSIIPREKVREMIQSGNYVPEISPLSDTIRLNSRKY